MKTEFEKWLLTESGTRCSDDKEIVKNPYLTNRLFWAFNAGALINVQFINMKKALDKAYLSIGILKRELKQKDKEIEKLKLELKKEQEYHLWV